MIRGSKKKSGHNVIYFYRPNGRYQDAFIINCGKRKSEEKDCKDSNVYGVESKGQPLHCFPKTVIIKIFYRSRAIDIHNHSAASVAI